jgi:hypothetical protein
VVRARHIFSPVRLCCSGSAGNPIDATLGEHMQSAQPRDLGVLIFVIGLFLVLFVTTLLLGTPVR